MSPPSRLRLGSLFSGYGGLDIAVSRVFGARTDWVSDIDPAANTVLAARFPGVPNLGDITRVDWSEVPRVDIVSGGSPCQDLSTAGKRAGMVDGTRSNLWVTMREAIAVLKPSYVVWENVRGANSATADSSLEPCPGCVGSAEQRGTVLRALGRVLGDLADLGFDAEWYGLSASDIGACHARFRTFVLAHKTDTHPPQWLDGRSHTVPRLPKKSQLLPTPNASVANDGEQPDTWLARRERVKKTANNGNGMGMPLSIAVQLLPTPRATDGIKGGPNQRGSKGDLTLPSVVCGRMRLLPTPSVADGKGGHERRGGSRGHELLLKGIAKTVFATDPDRWGEYAAAIGRHEYCFGRPPPEPTEPNHLGNPSLSPRFVEWMMGLPDGWVTDCGVTRNQALSLLGNGVVPAQAEQALQVMLARVPQPTLLVG